MVALSLVPIVFAIQGPARYKFAFRDLRDHYRLEVRSSSGQLIWGRRTLNRAAAWSSDHRSLFFADAPEELWRYGYRLSYWRNGKRLQKIHLPPLPGGLGEGIFKNGIKISPDDQLVLIRVAPTEGSFDLDTGWLICVDVASGRSTLFDGSSEKFRWLNTHTVEYYDWRNLGTAEDPKLRLSGPFLWTFKPEKQ